MRMDRNIVTGRYGPVDKFGVNYALKIEHFPQLAESIKRVV